MEQKNEALKCVVVGDGGVGKTSMLLKYVNGKFLDGYLPTCFDNYNALVDVEGSQINLNLIDTAGQETYDRLRTLSYYDTDVFIVCFSLVDPDSFINVKTRWLPELKEFKPGTPLILVGTKQDLREQEDDKSEYISYIKAKKLSRKVHADAYVECSALMDGGLQEVFRLAAISALGMHKKRTLWGSVKKLFKSNKCIK
ncbi:hypothetical protein LOTGIDRAFT_129708 [Lottia gigantea]|uniref:Uncharacterized protein n=1 Tax=Lottia gigantea TaxID=225164 RepID=V3ZUE0_LOTGI|nr:hypothetical protein LOTGIDRAFT_129708 [Lottia gigantea]ESO86200.1 hypothetical protein LOTGIDRAFT_129708 [Lottia gigantea]